MFTCSMRSVGMMIRTCLWNATLRRPASLVISIICLGIIWFFLLRIQQKVAPLQEDDNVDWEEEYERLRVASLKEHVLFYVGNKSAMQPVPAEWTARNACPACFGVDMCAAIDRKEVLVEIPKVPTAANKKGVFLGQWQDVPVAVKRMSNWYPTEFDLFDKFVCRNTTGTEKCNVSTAITDPKSYVQNAAAFRPENLLEAWRISYPDSKARALTYTLCITPSFVKRYSSLYDSDNDGVLTPHEKAMMFTAMVVQPESLMLKFLKGIQFQRLAPRVYGACGRLVVVEHGGRLLSTFLDSTFEERAELALQLLSMVQVFWHADRRWFALYKDFEFENIAVSHEKEIYIIDYEDLSIIENTEFDEANDEDKHEEHRYGHNVTCNEDCFKFVLDRLASSKLSVAERREKCESLHSIGGSLMYSTLCRNILSDLSEHRKVADKGNVSYRGLLHSIPEPDEDKELPDKLSKVLRECVTEKEPGGRVRAVNEIADLLSMFVKVH